MDTTYFIHQSSGILHFDPKKGTKHYEPWWALLACDEGLVDFYRWLLKTYGLDTEPNKLWGPHISAIKGADYEARADVASWGYAENQKVNFWYTNQIRWDNDKHAWLDCFSPELSEIRMKMGLTKKEHFHLTLGRLK